jgi:hypothetical protein
MHRETVEEKFKRKMLFTNVVRKQRCPAWNCRPISSVAPIEIATPVECQYFAVTNEFSGNGGIADNTTVKESDGDGHGFGKCRKQRDVH